MLKGLKKERIRLAAHLSSILLYVNLKNKAEGIRDLIESVGTLKETKT